MMICNYLFLNLGITPLIQIIQADETINDEVKSQWPVDENHEFYNSQMKYCDLFKSNQLYR